jgi:hypothetical protein
VADEWEKKLADAVSSGGISFSRVAVELVYLLPDDFQFWYARLFHTALVGADGGASSRAEADRKKGEVQRAGGQPVSSVKRGGRIKTGESTRAHGRAAKSTGGFRGLWAIGDERALRLKARVDKRLRAISRDIKAELEEMVNEDGRIKTGGEKGEGGKKINICTRCKRFLEETWNYCPACGTISQLGWQKVEASRKSKMKEGEEEKNRD